MTDIWTKVVIKERKIWLWGDLNQSGHYELLIVFYRIEFIYCSKTQNEGI